MLKFQILSHINQHTIALGRILAGKIGPRQFWMVEQRPVGPAWRSRSVSGIAYMAKSASGELYDENGVDLANLRTLHVGATTLCNGRQDPEPLFYVHVCPELAGDTQVTIYGEDGQALPEGNWRLITAAGANPRLYLPSAGHWQAAFSGADSQVQAPLMLRPVMRPWLSQSAAPGPGLLRLGITDTVSNIRIVKGAVDVGTSSPLLAISSDSDQPCWIKVTSAQIELYEGSSTVPVGVIPYAQTLNQRLSGVKQAIEAVSGWHARLLAPGRTAVHATGVDVSFLVTQGLTSVPLDGEATISGKCVFYSTHQPRPFAVSLPPAEAASSWNVRVASGHFISRELLSDSGRSLIAGSLGPTYSVAAATDAEWETDPALTRRRDQPQALGALVVGDQLDYSTTSPAASLGALTQTSGLEALVPLDETGRKWQAAGRLIEEVLEVWVGDKRYTKTSDVFSSIDRLDGTFITRFAITEPVRVGYKFYDDSLTFAGFHHPLDGAWRSAELNPRLLPAEGRYKSQLLVMTPARMTLSVTNNGATRPYTLVNPAPLRLVPADDPYAQERRLAGHWSTVMPLTKDGRKVQLPWRVLAVLHFRPTFGPSSTTLEDVSTAGGVLREDLSSAELARLSPDTRSWDLLTSRKAHQLSQSLVLYLPLSLTDKYSEQEIRQRAARMLPAATFFTIQWY